MLRFVAVPSLTMMYPHCRSLEWHIAFQSVMIYTNI